MDVYIDKIDTTELLGVTIKRLRTYSDEYSSLGKLSEGIGVMSVNRLRNLEKGKLREITKPELTMLFRLLCDDNDIDIYYILLDIIKGLSRQEIQKENWIRHLSERFCLGIDIE